ncbi:type VI secretion system baseplate subunit TssF [uncultured Methylobacterium sp.]|jgi:type VI secretion system protein ImpG|uniref:type VI secretion system baseplate subunit TssF n=1 Tax=uncultured Methylobacterium sp. TaxID=157278 RepID=UPI002609B31D|nr:type VI secretion system baseplate subunit TssF [uncultured Methylobacterium sp.]
MSDGLLSYYNRELDFLRRMAQDFAAAHPRIAGHLRLSGDAMDDPHVARLMQGVAFLNARTARKIDDEFPELVDTLLEVLYPHYLAPVPSMSVVRFRPSAEMTGPHRVAAGSMLETEAVDGEACRFRTCYPVTLWPIELTDAAMLGQPLAAPANPEAEGASAALGLTLRCLPDGMTFSELQPDRLRFYLRGPASQVYALQQMILNDTVSVALADGPGDPRPVILPPDAVSAVGFAPDEALLPYPARSQRAYGILTEFFVFPEKFLFFDVEVLRKVLGSAGRELRIYLYFRKRDASLERAVTKSLFALGCTPVVNLFPQRAEPIVMAANRFEHRVIPDCRREDVMEVHSLLGVSVTDSAGRQREVLPFYANRRGVEGPGLFWHGSRRSAPGRRGGTDLFLAFTGGDLSDATAEHAEWAVTLDTLCCNRDLPTRLPYGGGHPRLSLSEGSSAVAGIDCVVPPTVPLHGRLPGSHRWSLLCHLSLNHLSLTGEGGLDALKEILRLYDFRNSAETLRQIDGLVGLSARRGTARAPRRPEDPPWADALCRGIDVGITLDPAHFAGSGLFLFAMVLDHFLTLYASINSFTRLTATVRGQPGILRKWPARVGDRQVL